MSERMTGRENRSHLFWLMMCYRSKSQVYWIVEEIEVKKRGNEKIGLYSLGLFQSPFSVIHSSNFFVADLVINPAEIFITPKVDIAMANTIY
jgi:hypothetical protein